MRTVQRFFSRAGIAVLCCFVVLALSPAWAAPTCKQPQKKVEVAYQPQLLVSDGFTTTPNTDPNLVNAWGLAFGPEFAWVADNGTGVATLYNGLGEPQMLIVGIPGADGGPAAPTGVVFNKTNDFQVTTETLTGNPPTTETLTGNTRFLFASEDGTISGWSPEISPNEAILAVNRSSAMSVYKGIAIATDKNERSRKSRNLLYATDFHNGNIDVFDGKFNLVSVPGGFFDRTIPPGYAPFGISNVGGLLVVTYAKQDDAKHDDVKGPGFGFVRIFKPDGRLVHRLVSRTGLNAPWGIALAPCGFGDFSKDLLIGNFGDGTISAYDLMSGRFEGKLRNPCGRVITIDGLWAIVFGNGAPTQPLNTLFFTAGPNGEADGLFGRIDPVSICKPKPKDDKKDEDPGKKNDDPGKKNDDKGNKNDEKGKKH